MRLDRRILRTKLHFWISNRRIDRWAESVNVFFVLAMGRSGTFFLSQLLDRAERARVFHEPTGSDFIAHQDAFHDPGAAVRYIQRFRKKEIYLRARTIQMDQMETYGEVNSALRRHARALADAFPNAVLIHLIRDGRDVVRSMSARRTMTPKDKNTAMIRPRPGDPWAKQWEEMDRFARLCWYWQAENGYLRRTISGPAVHFESILASYASFREQILEPLDLQVDRESWRKAVERPRNPTNRHRLPPWEEWSEDRQQTFRAICGEEMRKNGYAC